MTISTDVYISLSLVFGNLYKSIRGFLFLVIGSIVRSSRTRYPLSCSVWKGKNTCFEIQCCKYDVSIRHACIDVGAIAFIGDSNTQCGDEMRLHVNTTNVQSSLATHSYRCVCVYVCTTCQRDRDRRNIFGAIANGRKAAGGDDDGKDD